MSGVVSYHSIDERSKVYYFGYGMENQEHMKQEYEILGQKIRFSPEKGMNKEQADRVIATIEGEAYKLQRQDPHRSSEQVAVLLLLKFVSEDMFKKEGLAKEIDILKLATLDAMKVLEATHEASSLS